MELILFSDCYRNRRVLLTGHTGFKGSWLALWLKNLGAHLSGIALAPEGIPNHWDTLKLDIPDHRIDIRDPNALSIAIKEERPEIVFHLAAQSLVRRSYRSPQETWASNVMGTVNLLEACRHVEEVKAIVIITTDKCYENKESAQGYREDDRLGGHDPYSASKAATELAVISYRDAFFKKAGSPLIVTARAGNVIGGGDWSEDRLIPDLIRAEIKGEILQIRSPYAVRPWQHVLEPLSGYLQLGQKLLENEKKYEGAWNFGPDKEATLSVSDVLTHMDAKWNVVPDSNLHETGVLTLDSSKARKELSWKPVLTIDQQFKMTREWYEAYYKKKAVISQEQFENYMEAAKNSKAVWI